MGNWLGLSDEQIEATPEYKAGFEAGVGGKKATENPHPPCGGKFSRSGWLWAYGHCDGYGQAMLDADALADLAQRMD